VWSCPVVTSGVDVLQPGSGTSVKLNAPCLAGPTPASTMAPVTMTATTALCVSASVDGRDHYVRSRSLIHATPTPVRMVDHVLITGLVVMPANVLWDSEAGTVKKRSLLPVPPTPVRTVVAVNLNLAETLSVCAGKAGREDTARI